MDGAPDIFFRHCVPLITAADDTVQLSGSAAVEFVGVGFIAKKQHFRFIWVRPMCCLWSVIAIRRRCVSSFERRYKPCAASGANAVRTALVDRLSVSIALCSSLPRIASVLADRPCYYIEVRTFVSEVG